MGLSFAIFRFRQLHDGLQPQQARYRGAGRSQVDTRALALITSIKFLLIFACNTFSSLTNAFSLSNISLIVNSSHDQNPLDILIGPCPQFCDHWPLSACVAVSGLTPHTGSASPRSASRPSCTAGITSPRSPSPPSPGPPPAAAAAQATAAPGPSPRWTTPSLISQEQTNKCSNILSKLHCVPQ